MEQKELEINLTNNRLKLYSLHSLSFYPDLFFTIYHSVYCTSFLFWSHGYKIYEDRNFCLILYTTISPLLEQFLAHSSTQFIFIKWINELWIKHYEITKEKLTTVYNIGSVGKYFEFQIMSFQAILRNIFVGDYLFALTKV